MELNIYISLKDKLKPKLKLSQLQIYWVNEILLLFLRSINKDTRVHEQTKRTFLCALIIQQNPDKSWFKACAMGVHKINSLMKTMAENGLRTLTLRTSVLENEWFLHWRIRILLIAILCSYQDKIFRVLATSVMFHKNNRKVCQECWEARLQYFKLKPTPTSKQQNNKVQCRQQQGYSRALCFMEEIQP